MKILIISGLAESLISFRGPLIMALQTRGLQLHVAAPNLPAQGRARIELEAMGVTVHEVPMVRAGTNPFSDLRTILALWCLMRRSQPTMVLGYNIKPAIYGSIAAWLARVPKRFVLITGLGYAFTGEATGMRKWVQWVAQFLYAQALSKVTKVFFQNKDDRELFDIMGLIPRNAQVVVVNGSGVDIAKFVVEPLPKTEVHFLLIARLLGDKGVREYVQAARIVRCKYPHIRFSLAGWIDKTPDAIDLYELDAWVSGGDIEFLGKLSDVRPVIAACSVYVLPSYREGTPRTVLEAMAMGRPIITTDAPGCRETVVDEGNGFLVPVKDVNALVQAMQRFINEPMLIGRMGARSREIVEEKYDVHNVNAVMLREMGIT